MMDEESKISYNDLTELMKQNILPKAERQNKVMYYLISGY
jgi:hypothetical protein